MIKIAYKLIDDPIEYSLFFDKLEDAQGTFDNVSWAGENWVSEDAKSASGDKVAVCIPKTQIKCVRLIEIDEEMKDERHTMQAHINNLQAKVKDLTSENEELRGKIDLIKVRRND